MARVARESFALEYIKRVRAKDPGLGGLKLWSMYQRDLQGSSPLGRDKFLSILDAHGLKLRKKLRKPRTTDSTHGLPVYRNLVKNFIPPAPNRLWVSDITYITLWNADGTYRFCYLSLILDACSEEIVGWSLGPSLETRYPVEALQMALGRIANKPDHELIHHSDRGCQYASNEYVSMLTSHGVRISMTENGDPKENAQAERVNNTIKNELLLGMRFCSIENARSAIGKAIDFYNNERPHMSLDMKTPAEAGAYDGSLPNRWRSRRQEHIRELQREADKVE